MLTPVRVVCQNTLNLAISQASRMWSTKHVGNINYKMEEAQRTLLMAKEYMHGLSEEAEKMAQEKITNQQINDFIEMLFPLEQDASNRKIENVMSLRSGLLKATNVSDIQNFRNTKWGFINAVTDFVGHSEPQRQTQTFAEKRFAKIIDGHPIVDRAYDILIAA